MHQILFYVPIFGGIPVHGFGVMLLVAMLGCLWMATWRAKRVGLRPEFIQDLALWLFIPGIIGARIVYLYYHAGPMNVGQFLGALVRFWDGGIVFYGSVIGGTIGYFVGYFLIWRRQGIRTLVVADVVAPTIALGLFFGRIGCLLNGCCYGDVACATCPAVHYPLSAELRFKLVKKGYQTAAGFLLDGSGKARVDAVEPGSAADRAGLLPGDVIVVINSETKEDTAKRLWGEQGVGGFDLSPSAWVEFRLSSEDWPRGANDLKLTVLREGEERELPVFRPRTLGVQPTQVYESISMLLLMMVLFAFDPLRRRPGQVMALMMIGYAIHRYVNELLRADFRPVGFESNVSVLLLAGGVVMLVWVSLRKAPATTPEPVSPPAPAATRAS